MSRGCNGMSWGWAVFCRAGRSYPPPGPRDRSYWLPGALYWAQAGAAKPTKAARTKLSITHVRDISPSLRRAAGSAPLAQQRRLLAAEIANGQFDHPRDRGWSPRFATGSAEFVINDPRLADTKLPRKLGLAPAHPGAEINQLQRRHTP
jgi:hypothetical protein